jgi:hypothetical protein
MTGLKNPTVIGTARNSDSRISTLLGDARIHSRAFEEAGPLWRERDAARPGDRASADVPHHEPADHERGACYPSKHQDFGG